jgi:nucleoside-diphosphate-sugar epimerase
MPIYNVGSGKEWSVLKIAETLGGEIQHIPARQEPRRSLADVTAIKRELNWEPKTDLLEWLKMQK